VLFGRGEIFGRTSRLRCSRMTGLSSPGGLVAGGSLRMQIASISVLIYQ
jgi:hypothetical protein